MSDELRIWLVSNVEEVEPLLPLNEMPTEWEFEELLVGNPEMLEPDLRLVGVLEFVDAVVANRAGCADPRTH